MNHTELKDFLDYKAEQYEHPDFIASDPIQLPKRFTRKQDIEIVALLVSTIAWGNRKSIIKSGEQLLDIMDHDPYNWLLSYSTSKQADLRFVHRTFNTTDLHYFFTALASIYQSTDTLEELFVTPDHQIKSGIIQFRTHFLGFQPEVRTSKHVSDPSRNSASKRLNMFLRWMVRSQHKGVDFGLWKRISTESLYIPLDVHTGNMARKLQLLDRKQDDWKALEQLMQTLREFDPTDPVKYDFALFGLGVFERF